MGDFNWEKYEEDQRWLELVVRLTDPSDICHVSVALVGWEMEHSERVFSTWDRRDVTAWLEQQLATSYDIHRWCGIQVRWREVEGQNYRIAVLSTMEWNRGERWPEFVEWLG